MKKFHLIHNLYMALFAVYNEPMYFADVTIGDMPVHEVEDKIASQLLKTGNHTFLVSDKEGNWAEEVIVEATDEKVISITKRRWNDGYEYERYNILEGMVVVH